MPVTPTTHTGLAGGAAGGAGQPFIAVQVGHPHLDVASATTPEYMVRQWPEDPRPCVVIWASTHHPQAQETPR